ncbi:9092_t:CDS:2, partial [Acaulospora colombiana]
HYYRLNMSSSVNAWVLSYDLSQDSDIELANKLSCVRPEAREYLLKLFSTRDFKSNNLRDLYEAGASESGSQEDSDNIPPSHQDTMDEGGRLKMSDSSSQEDPNDISLSHPDTI